MTGGRQPAGDMTSSPTLANVMARVGSNRVDDEQGGRQFQGKPIKTKKKQHKEADDVMTFPNLSQSKQTPLKNTFSYVCLYMDGTCEGADLSYRFITVECSVYGKQTKRAGNGTASKFV